MLYSVISSGYINAATKQVVATGTGGGQTGGGAPGAVLHGLFLISDGTNTCSCVLYHGSAATGGNELASLAIAASTKAPQSIIFNNPIACPDGLYLTTSGTGVNAIVYYSLGS